MSAIDRRGGAEPRQHFSSVFFMQEDGGCLSRLAPVCACLQAAFFDPKRNFKTVPYNADVRASWRMCDPAMRHNNQHV